MNNASILTIFSLKLCNFLQISSKLCNFSQFFVHFPQFLKFFSSFFWKNPNFGPNFWVNFKILKTTHNAGLRKDKDFSKKYTPMPTPHKVCTIPYQSQYQPIYLLFCMSQYHYNYFSIYSFVKYILYFVVSQASSTGRHGSTDCTVPGAASPAD